jgi:hypothetical protein
VNWYTKKAFLQSAIGYWLGPDGKFNPLKERESHVDAIPRVAKQYGINGFTKRRVTLDEDGTFESFLLSGFVRFFNGYTVVVSKAEGSLNDTQISAIMDNTRPDANFYITTGIEGPTIETKDREDVRSTLMGNQPSPMEVERYRMASQVKTSQTEELEESFREWTGDQKESLITSITDSAIKTLKQYPRRVFWDQPQIESFIRGKIEDGEPTKNKKQLTENFVFTALLHGNTKNTMDMSWDLAVKEPDFKNTFLILFSRGKVGRAGAPFAVGRYYDYLRDKPYTPEQKAVKIEGWFKKLDPMIYPGQIKKAQSDENQDEDMDLLREVMPGAMAEFNEEAKQDTIKKNLADLGSVIPIFNKDTGLPWRHSIKTLCEAYGLSVISIESNSDKSGAWIHLVEKRQDMKKECLALTNHLNRLPDVKKAVLKTINQDDVWIEIFPSYLPTSLDGLDLEENTIDMPDDIMD